MDNETVYIVLEQPIKAMVNSNTLEVFTVLDEHCRFFDPTVVVVDGIEYVSIDEIIEAVNDLNDNCCDGDHCDDTVFITMLEELKNEILRAVSV